MCGPTSKLPSIGITQADPILTLRYQTSLVHQVSCEWAEGEREAGKQHQTKIRDVPLELGHAALDIDSSAIWRILGGSDIGLDA